jgi:hypothetical protein
MSRRRQPANPRSFHIDRRAAEIVTAPVGSDDDLLTTPQTADWLGVSVQWLEIRRSRGGGPPFERLSPKIVRYRRGKVRSWLDQRAHARTADYSKQIAKKRKTEARLSNAT